MDKAKLHLKDAGKRLLDGGRQVQRLQNMWRDLKDFVRATSIMLLGEYYDSVERAWALFTWRMARVTQRGMVLRDHVMVTAGEHHSTAMAWTSSVLGLEQQQAQQLLMVIYTLLLVAFMSLFVRGNTRR